LQTLVAEPPDELYRLLEDVVDTPTPTRTQLQRSLRRILDVPVTQSPAPPHTDAPRPAAGKGTHTLEEHAAKQKYDIGYHTAGKPAGVIDLFEQVDEAARSLGGDVVRKVGKVSVNYFAGKRSFGSIKPLTSKVVVFLGLDPVVTVPRNPAVMRSLVGIGHHGNGDVEYLLSTTDQLAEVRELMSEAYQRAQ
jgi:predicted transport protein